MPAIRPNQTTTQPVLDEFILVSLPFNLGLVLAVPSCLLEPIWVEFHAAIGEEPPEFDLTHPLGCHRRRIPVRVVFEHLVDPL